ncbi:hypothetical protein [Mycobacterium sp.]|nr:hypothetical protein [Mycobacterium sp.]HTY34900.1 hypothetical protein [Mycobacterium sp.]
MSVWPGRIERAMEMLRRALRYEVSVGALVELALWPASLQIADACPAR